MVPFLVPLALQIGFGNSASQSGMISFATALGAFVMKPMAQFALRLAGFRNVLMWNAVAAAFSVALCAAFRPGWPVAALFATLLFGGLCRSLYFTTTNTLVYAEVPHAKLSAATSFSSTVQQLSMALGVAVAAAVLQASVTLGGRGGPAPVDFSAGFLIGAALMLLAAPLALRLPPEAGEGIVTGRRRG
jgi:Na+/melibiose symporter-like transporter